VIQPPEAIDGQVRHSHDTHMLLGPNALDQLLPERRFVPHSSRERPGDVKKRQERLEHRIHRSEAGFEHRRW
jgi:hypothetical protein